MRGSVTRAITPDYDVRGQACGSVLIYHLQFTIDELELLEDRGQKANYLCSAFSSQYHHTEAAQQGRDAFSLFAPGFL